ncbi:MAG: Trk system potassium uptake protein TrkA [Verrucomicrobia subdivision 3 bacterium]|nr:Trk system potassium uptake protein TrkA [Limisphaerales bacterium]MCS1417318.1 Trk system potassium uptake protein TrkA [Limisphaerales bacterium]
MNIIIVGAGEVGKHLAQSLSTQLHNITLIDHSEDVTASLHEKLDATIVSGNGTSATVLAENNVADCDLFLAITSHDNTNLVSASIAKSMGAKTTIARVHASVERGEWLFNHREHFGIDYLFSTERLAAVELGKFVRNPEGLVIEEIARGRIELQQLVISKESDIIEKPLSSLDLPKGVRIAIIYRNKGNLIPGGGDHLEPGDLVTLFGEPVKIQELSGKLNPETNKREEKNIVIFGGGEYAMALAEMIEGPEVKVRIMERSESECKRLSNLLQDTVIINGDATSLQQLREEQVGEADFFIAVSPDDEDNVMTCLQAKSLGTEYCLTLIHRPDVANAVYRNRERLGILGVVSPRLASNRDLLRFVETEKFHNIAHLQADVEVIQLVIKDDACVVGKRVSDIKWPNGGSLVGLVRKQLSIVPSGDDELQAGDAVYVVVTPESQKPFVKLLTK